MIEAFHRAADLPLGDWRACIRLGAALEQASRIEEATSCFVKALEPDAKNLLDSASLLVRQTNGQDPVALDILAAAQAKLGRFDEAVAAASRALEIRPTTGPAALAKTIRERLEFYRHGKTLERPDAR